LGKFSLHFDGADDYLAFSPLELNGLEGMTIALVCANWRQVDNEHWGDEGGSHGTVNAALLFEEVGEHGVWGTVFLSPFQNRIAMRFGSGQEGNMDFWRRPHSMEGNYSVTVAVKEGWVERLYVNGEWVEEFTGKLNRIDCTDSVGWLGRGRVDTYGPFDIAEVLIYDLALSSETLKRLHEYLMTGFPA
jgi:hypothetical protein